MGKASKGEEATKPKKLKKPLKPKHNGLSYRDTAESRHRMFNRIARRALQGGFGGG
jgi:hypothetical protein